MFTVRQFDSKTISWWYMERGNIDFYPSYQRKGGIWSPKDKAYLIDSILNDYDMPKIYIADFTYVNTLLNEKKKPFAIIDGKQRFEAIFDFFDSKLRLAEDFQFFQEKGLKLGGLSYQELKISYPKVASKFEIYNLPVMSVISDEESKINELFVRLNRNKPLLGAEVRSAMKGKVPILIKNLANNKFFKEKIKFSTKRKQDENVAAKILLTEFRGKFVDTKKIHLDRFVEEGIKSESVGFNRAAQRAEKILSRMASVFKKKDPLLKASGAIPLYYWLFKDTYPDYQEAYQFLVSFEKERQVNRKRAMDSKTKKIADRRLLEYDIAIRNSNDEGSLSKCYVIMIEKYISQLDEKIKNEEQNGEKKTTNINSTL